jgi:hypothetical protein
MTLTQLTTMIGSGTVHDLSGREVENVDFKSCLRNATSGEAGSRLCRRILPSGIPVPIPGNPIRNQ